MLLGDEQVRRLPRAAAVAGVRSVLDQLAASAAVAPARQRVELGDGAIVITGGRLTRPDVRGFRAYETHGDHEQVVVVWDAAGRVDAVVHGDELGPLRTGAIGAVALDHLAPREIGGLAILGAGPQAMEQLACIATVRPLDRVVVWSPRAESRGAFVDRAGDLHGITVTAAGSPAEAVSEADVVVSATSATRPFLTAEQLRHVAHFNAVGPKGSHGHELPREVFERPGLLVTDAPDQAHAYGDLLVAPSTLQALAPRVAAGETRADDVRRSVFVSLGLAGTDLAVACAVRDHCR